MEQSKTLSKGRFWTFCLSRCGITLCKTSLIPSWLLLNGEQSLPTNIWKCNSTNACFSATLNNKLQQIRTNRIWMQISLDRPCYTTPNVTAVILVRLSIDSPGEYSPSPSPRIWLNDGCITKAMIKGTISLKILYWFYTALLLLDMKSQRKGFISIRALPESKKGRPQFRTNGRQRQQ